MPNIPTKPKSTPNVAIINDTSEDPLLARGLRTTRYITAEDNPASRNAIALA